MLMSCVFRDILEFQICPSKDRENLKNTILVNIVGLHISKWHFAGMDLREGGASSLPAKFCNIFSNFFKIFSNFFKICLKTVQKHQFWAWPTLADVIFSNFFKLAPLPKIPESIPSLWSHFLNLKIHRCFVPKCFLKHVFEFHIQRLVQGPVKCLISSFQVR